MPLTLFVRFERVVQGLLVSGCWRPNRTEIFWPPLLWPSMLCLSRSLDAQPEALGSTLLGAGFLYCILSASSLDPNSSRPKGPFRLMWLSLPLLVISVSNSTGTAPAELNCQLPSTQLATSTRTRTQLSYIMV